MTGGAMFGSMGRGPQGSSHPSDAATDSFRVEVDPGNPSVVTPVGELDMVTVDELEGALRQAFDCGCRELVLDLRGLSFLDSQGLHLIQRWNSLAERSGITFAVIQGRPAVRRLFEIVGSLDQLPLVRSIGEWPATSLRDPVVAAEAVPLAEVSPRRTAFAINGVRRPRPSLQA